MISSWKSMLAAAAPVESFSCRRLVAASVVVVLLAISAFAGAPPAAEQKFGVVDAIVQDAIHDGQIPGAVVLIWHNDQVIYRKAFGHRSLEPKRELMSLDTIFDIASLTKVVATTTAVM